MTRFCITSFDCTTLRHTHVQQFRGQRRPKVTFRLAQPDLVPQLSRNESGLVTLRNAAAKQIVDDFAGRYDSKWPLERIINMGRVIDA